MYRSRHNPAYNKRHWAKDDSKTLCGRTYANPPRIINGFQCIDQVPVEDIRLAWCKEAVSCKHCLRKLPTRHERLTE